MHFQLEGKQEKNSYIKILVAYISIQGLVLSWPFFSVVPQVPTGDTDCLHMKYSRLVGSLLGVSVSECDFVRIKSSSSGQFSSIYEAGGIFPLLRTSWISWNYCHFVRTEADTLVASKASDHNPGAGGLQPGMWLRRIKRQRQGMRWTSRLTSASASNRWLLFIEQEQKRNDRFMGPIYVSLAKLEQHTLTAPMPRSTQKSVEHVWFWSQLPLHTWHTLQIQNRTEHHNDHDRVPGPPRWCALETGQAHLSWSHEIRFLQDGPSELTSTKAGTALFCSSSSLDVSLKAMHDSKILQNSIFSAEMGIK